jgi:hypothetical protein
MKVRKRFYSNTKSLRQSEKLRKKSLAKISQNIAGLLQVNGFYCGRTNVPSALAEFFF